MTSDQFSDGPYASAFDHIREAGWVCHCRWFESIDSTNDYLKRSIAVESEPRGPHLVVAQHQSAGRGRGINRWWSPPGVLAYSLLLNSDVSDQCQERLPQISLVTAIAIAEVLDGIISSPCQLKWPNDVYVQGKKICGILVESVIKGGKVCSIIGVGINVDVDFVNAPEGLQNYATSLHQHTMLRPQLEDVLVQSIRSLKDCIERWKADENFLSTNFSDRCYLSGKIVEVESSGRLIRGFCDGINHFGELKINTEIGDQVLIRTGAIRSIQSI